jgi:Uma2 family endonuclease
MDTQLVSARNLPASPLGDRARHAGEDLWETLRARDLEEKMGQGGAHADRTDLFVQVLRVLIAEQDRIAYVNWDLFVEWDPNDPRARVSPDVLLIDGQPPDIQPSLWRTWEPGCDPPRFALEIVSDRSRAKDYDDNPGKYAALGVEELAIFDPAAAGPEAPRGSILLQVYRRTPRGQFLLAYAGIGPVRSEVLRAWLVVTDGGSRLRLARDAGGTDLVPTADERRKSAESRAEAAEARVKELEELLRLRDAGKT